MSFAEFKKGRKEKYGDVMKEMEKMNKGGGFEKDKRIWSIVTDKAGNGYSVIRFLPQKDDNKLFCVQRFSHSYKYNGKYYIENCPTTVGIDGERMGECPQCEDNKQYWSDNSNKEDNNFARPRSRKTEFYANIVVVDDPSNPENNDKIFIFKFGKQIKEKIDDKLKPKNDREKEIFVYDFWEGCNLKLKVFQKKTADGEFLSYENSEWETQSKLFGGDDKKLEEVYNKLYDIDEFKLKDKFKSYEDLKKRVKSVCYGEEVAENISEKKKSEEKSEPEPEKVSESKVEEKTKLPLENEEKSETKKEEQPEFPDIKEDEEEAEDDSSFFSKFKS